MQHSFSSNPEDFNIVRATQTKPVPVDKSRGLKQFSKTRVESCSRVVLVHGQKQAIPLYVQARDRNKQRLSTHCDRTTTEQSYTHRKRYTNFSPDKPLARYDPNHQRNRLPIIFKKPRTQSTLFTEPDYPQDHRKRYGRQGTKSSIMYQSVEHSYIGNFKGVQQQTANHEINMLRRRKHRNLSKLLN